MLVFAPSNWGKRKEYYESGRLANVLPVYQSPRVLGEEPGVMNECRVLLLRLVSSFVCVVRSCRNSSGDVFSQLFTKLAKVLSDCPTILSWPTESSEVVNAGERMKVMCRRRRNERRARSVAGHRQVSGYPVCIALRRRPHFKRLVLSRKPVMLLLGTLGNEKPRAICASTYVDERLKRLSAYFSNTALWCLRGFSQQSRIVCRS